MRVRPSEIAIHALLLGGVGSLMVTAPTAGDFWWSDAPRHALNGVFVKDLIAAVPADPERWAIEYYLQYPAVTILFYPPLFPFVEALFFGFFGNSHGAALAAVGSFYVALAFGSYRLFGHWLDRWPAAAAALLLAGTLEVALWGRQVMLEIPAFACLVWSTHLFLRWTEERRPRLLYLAMLILLAGLYTKQTVIFMVPVFATVLWMRRGWEPFRERHVWIAASVFLLCLLPLAVLTLEFGQANVASVAGLPTARSREPPWKDGSIMSGRYRARSGG